MAERKQLFSDNPGQRFVLANRTPRDPHHPYPEPANTIPDVIRNLVRPIFLAALLALGAAACGSEADAATTSVPQAAVTTTTTAAPTTTTAPATTLTSLPAVTTPSTTTTTTLPPKGRLVVSATGDVNLDPTYIPTLASEGYGYAWSGLQDIFRNDDLSIVNLECAASPLGSAEPKEFTFRCDTDALPLMLQAGVEVANLGNNHSGDYGKDALVDSRTQLQTVGVAPVGVGVDAAEAHAPAVFEINGWTVAVVGFGGVVPAPSWIAADDRPGMADGDTIATMVAAVEAADEIADLVLVTIHWGVELDTTPRPEDRERAEAMIAAGADAIFGHHAHRLQPLEIVDGVPVAWGLGNFVWPTLSRAGSTTAVAQVVFEPDGSVRACLVPTFIERPGHPVLQVEHDPDDPCAEG
jgi:poly-gamma-glutamate synthesis protein (capsule biosynthesis protein)